MSTTFPAPLDVSWPLVAPPLALLEAEPGYSSAKIVALPDQSGGDDGSTMYSVSSVSWQTCTCVPPVLHCSLCVTVAS